MMDSYINNKGWNYSYTYARSLACIAIVVLHTVYSAVVLNRPSLTPAQQTGSMMIVQNMMWAVPCFVMITGALLLDPNKTVTFKKLYSVYILRVFGALVLFGVFFRVFDVFMDHEPKTPVSFLKGFAEIFTGTSWSHLWYLYLLIGLYLLLPFYKKIASNSDPKEIRYLLLIYGIFLSVLPVLHVFGIETAFYIHVSSIYPFYLFFGYALRSGIIKINRVLSWCLTVVSTVAILVLTYFRVTGGINEIDSVLGYSSIPVAVQSIGVFSLFNHFRADGIKGLNKFVMSFDQCSFGIYLLHMVFVRLVLRYWEVNPYNHYWLFPALIAAFTLVSYLCVLVLRKIPYLNKII